MRLKSEAFRCLFKYFNMVIRSNILQVYGVILCTLQLLMKMNRLSIFFICYQLWLPCWLCHKHLGKHWCTDTFAAFHRRVCDQTSAEIQPLSYTSPHTSSGSWILSKVKLRHKSYSMQKDSLHSVLKIIKNVSFWWLCILQPRFCVFHQITCFAKWDLFDLF